MLQQLFGKPFWVTLAVLAGMFGVSLLVFQNFFAPIVLGVVFIGVLALTIRRLEWGIAVAFAELFANSHGHLISVPVGPVPLSLREVVFAAVMLGWLVHVIRKTVEFPVRDPRLMPFIGLAAAVAVGATIGLLQNAKIDAIQDGNAYLYAAYVLPILSVRWTNETKRLLLQVLAAGATWAAILTIGLLYVFTHFPVWILGPVYTFIRDTRTGELTRMDPSLSGEAPVDPDEATGLFFRIFLQAQISIIAMWFLVSPWLWERVASKRDRLLAVAWLAFGLSAVLVSLSRSFWMGMAVAGVVFLVLMLAAHRPKISEAAKAIAAHVLSGPLAVLFIVLIILFPLPYRTGTTEGLAALFSSRATQSGDVAISSRWNLLPPLWDEIRANPVLGSGFGETVTFKTDDPRARAISPDGTWTTYALEWGWLELWLKMGILGPLAFIWLFVATIRGLWGLLQSEQKWLGAGLICVVVMLYVTHVFSPYLNHPLGLGLLLFALPFYKTQTPAKEAEGVARAPVGVPVAQASVAPLTSE